MITVRFQGKAFSITVIQVYAPTSNAEEAEVEWFYEDLQDLLELTPQKDVLFIIGDWNAKVGSQETPGVTGKFGLGLRNEAGKSLIEFSQEKALVRANTLLQQHKRRLYTWTSSNGQYRNQIDYILYSQRYTYLNAEFQRIEGRYKKPSSMVIEKKQRKTIEWERLEISSIKLEIPREYFMQNGHNKGQKQYEPNRSRRY